MDEVKLFKGRPNLLALAWLTDSGLYWYMLDNSNYSYKNYHNKGTFHPQIHSWDNVDNFWRKGEMSLVSHLSWLHCCECGEISFDDYLCKDCRV